MPLDNLRPFPVPFPLGLGRLGDDNDNKRVSECQMRSNAAAGVINRSRRIRNRITAETWGGIPLRKYQFARLVFYAPLLRVKGLRVLGDDAIRGTGFWENKTDEHT